ncbi:hypothetical protein VTI74DRAFT_4692 [Chaetomium olivicolor]
MSSSKRFVGLSNKQSVPRLLSRIGNPATTRKMPEVDINAPPLSSSDLSEEDGLPTKTDIQPTRFVKSSQGRPQSSWDTTDYESSKKSTTPAFRFKRTRASERPASTQEPRLGVKDTDSKSDMAEAGETSSPPPSKKLKKSPPGDGELGSHFRSDDPFLAAKKQAQRRLKTFGGRARQETSPARTFKPPPKEDKPDLGSPEKKKFCLPSSPSEASAPASSPARKFKAVPASDLGSPRKRIPPLRKKWLKMSEEHPEEEESQRPIFRIPDEIPEPDIILREDETILSPPAGTPTGSNLPQSVSSSPLTDLESIDLTPRCMLCNEEVPQGDLDLFKSRHPHMTVSNMQKFCQHHKRRSARDTWTAKGYPDIEWHRLDSRIAQHYPVLKAILLRQQDSHYLSLFEDSIRGGRNRTLLRSDANLTPGYYGIRGLRAMSENLMGEFATLLYETSLRDKLVSARGHTTYLQSVLVPELAVRLVMEDMGVGEEEARGVVKESSAVGELLNDEVPDVVVEERSEEEQE